MALHIIPPTETASLTGGTSAGGDPMKTPPADVKLDPKETLRVRGEFKALRFANIATGACLTIAINCAITQQWAGLYAAAFFLICCLFLQIFQNSTVRDLDTQIIELRWAIYDLTSNHSALSGERGSGRGAGKTRAQARSPSAFIRPIPHEGSIN